MQDDDDLVEKMIEEMRRRQEEKEVRSRLMLHYWHISEVECGGEKWICAKGNVSGHNRLMDTSSITTSKVRDVVVDEPKGEVILHTQNSVYYCPLEYCDFDKQREFSGLLEGCEALEKKYFRRLKDPQIEEGNVLLVLSDFDPYYCNGMYCYDEDNKTLRKIKGSPHIGTFKDSYLINTEDYSIDIRYFPHYKNIEFYMLELTGKQLWVENIGGSTLYVKAPCGIICIQPGERKAVKKENAEKERLFLDGGDLYLARFID